MSQPENNTFETSLFISQETWLHKLHPFNKLVYILLTGVVVYLGPGEWYFEGILIALNLGLAISGDVFKATWRLSWRTLLPLAFFMILIHGFLNPANRTILASLGWVHFYQEGLLFALNMLLQLTAMLTASLLFVLCTHPANRITAISQAG